jgi:hypothetical protein
VVGQDSVAPLASAAGQAHQEYLVGLAHLASRVTQASLATQA